MVKPFGKSERFERSGQYENCNFMRLLGAICLAGLTSIAFCDTTYLGLYLKGDKMGYSSYVSSPAKLDGKNVVCNQSKTVMDAGLLGSEMTVTMDSTSWSTKDGHPIRMIFDTISGGRSNKVDAEFGQHSVILKIVNGGVKSTQSLIVPADAQVVDDPLTLVLTHKIRIGSQQTVYVLDPTTASLMKNLVVVVGFSQTSIDGKKVSATLIRVTDPRAVTDVFVGQRGEIIRVDGPMGLYMLPISKATAMARNGKYRPSTDLAITTSIKADKNLPNPEELTHLKMRLFSESINSIPSDQYQTATKMGQGWQIDIHPPKLSVNKAATILNAANGKAEWLKASLNMPSNSLIFRKLAQEIIGSKKDVQSAAFAIQNYVNLNMTPNAGIGVLRDATEVLATKEGVCRDYATLTVTLLRAAGIPARLASGLVSWDGTFYYHAWAEAWDGLRWIGVDSTTNRSQMSASHVKLGDGNVDTAFTFSFLEKARIEVMEVSKE